MSKAPDRSQAGILAVIVLYKLAPLESVSYQSLQASLQRAPDPSLLRIMFYDNTPGGQPGVLLPDGAIYESRAANDGIAVAYNRALAIARDQGFGWLLTLDQDTSLPLDFVARLAAAVSFVQPLAHVGAVVPQIRDGGRLLSPNTLALRLFPRFFPDSFVGVALDNTTSAVNSASTLRVSALEAIGGYDPRFRMDYSDAVMYHRLQQEGFRVFVAGNIQVNHELSVLDMQNRVSYERYEEILGAESAFWDECMGRIAGPALLLRFSYRLFYKFWRTGGSFAYVRISARFLWRRLVYSRKRRMDLWQQALRKRFSSSA